MDRCERKVGDAVGPLGSAAVGYRSDSGKQGMTEDIAYEGETKFDLNIFSFSSKHIDGRLCDRVLPDSTWSPGWNSLTGSDDNTWFPVQGSVPEEYGSLSTLETLALPGLQLNGTIPTSVSGLQVTMGGVDALAVD